MLMCLDYCLGNSVDNDVMMHSMASDQDLQCFSGLFVPLLGVYIVIVLCIYGGVC